MAGNKTVTLDEAILRLVSQRKIPDQAALLGLLRRNGFKPTQPTLSRHLRKLGVHKAAGLYRRAEPQATGIPSFTLTPVPPGLLVLHTRPGYAQPLAVRLDQEKIAGVAGTIAGDDTVFIAVASPPPLAVVTEAIGKLLSGTSPI